MFLNLDGGCPLGGGAILTHRLEGVSAHEHLCRT